MKSSSMILPFAGAGTGVMPKAGLHESSHISSASGLSEITSRTGVSCDWFTQPVDHKNVSMGTWGQQYCVSREWWAGPGSPVIIMTPGEEPLIGSVSPGRGYTFVDNTTMPGLYAQALGAATVVLEHRYFGQSSPWDGLDSETLQYLTTDQAAADVVNFAQNIVFPFDKNQTSISPKAPWVYFGASYSGMLGSWIEHFHPGVFWAFHLSSAVVEVNNDNWYYYDTIRKGINAKRADATGSAGCSLALASVADFADNILLAATPNATKIDALKNFFGAAFPIADDDFAYAIATPFRNWQQTEGYTDVLKMCDAVVATSSFNSSTAASLNATAQAILGNVPIAVQNFAAYFKQTFLNSTCTYFDVWGQDDPLWCLNTHDMLNPFFEAQTLGNPWRTWYWFLCNEPIASWATGAPKGQPSIVSRKIDSNYWQRQCSMHFPTLNGNMYGSAAGKTPDSLNKKTGGWLRSNTTRVIWTNGEFDPWRATTMSSEIRPGGPLQSTPDVPVFLMKNAEHGDDSFTAKALNNTGMTINPEVQAVQDKAVEIMARWVGQWNATKSS